MKNNPLEREVDQAAERVLIRLRWPRIARPGADQSAPRLATISRPAYGATVVEKLVATPIAACGT